MAERHDEGGRVHRFDFKNKGRIEPEDSADTEIGAQPQ